MNQDFCLYGDHILHGMKAHDKQMTKYVAILAVISVPPNLSMVMMTGMWGFSESILRIGKTCCLRDIVEQRCKFPASVCHVLMWQEHPRQFRGHEKRILLARASVAGNLASLGVTEGGKVSAGLGSFTQGHLVGHLEKLHLLFSVEVQWRVLYREVTTIPSLF